MTAVLAAFAVASSMALSGGPAAAAPATVPAPRCSMPGSRTIASNHLVRVFRAPTPLGEVYGCLRSARRAFALGVALECQNYDEIDGAVVAGTRVLLNVRTCGLDFTQSSVRLVNLRTGHRQFSSAPLASTPPSAREYDAVRGMVLLADGRMAWLGVRVSSGKVVEAEVRRRAHGSSTKAVGLDRGAGVDPRSLRRGSTRAFWSKDGTRRSAPL